MRLAIRHLTTYRYSQPVSYEIQTLRLSPRSYDGLAIVSWDVRGERNRALPSFIDGLGNLVHTNTINRPHEAAVVAVAGVVETRPTGGRVRDAREPLAPGYFLRGTKLTPPDDAIAAFAAACARGTRPLDRLLALMEGVGERIAYVRGATTAVTTAAEALASGAGVCQDHAHLFAAACRSLGIPARYVGGYFWAGEDAAPHQASHAWAEAFVDDLGWVGFDPTNRSFQDDRHVRVGVGLDYWSAGPVRGIRRGEADELLSVTLDVAAARSGQ